MGEFNQQKYINDFIREKYDVIRVQFPKGYKETLKKRSQELGFKSVNAYIKYVIANDIKTVSPEEN